jgi:hypothetical protein
VACSGSGASSLEGPEFRVQCSGRSGIAQPLSRGRRSRTRYLGLPPCWGISQISEPEVPPLATAEATIFCMRHSIDHHYLYLCGRIAA